jgi:prevent-host-death family protein
MYIMATRGGAKAKMRTQPGPARVGIRDIRQNLSKYLARVAQGESIEITEHGRPVAQLAPLPQNMSSMERMYAAGLIRRGNGNLLALGPPPPRPAGTRPLSEILQEMRDEERML